MKSLDDVLHTSFKKIRIKTGGRKTEAQELIEQKTKLSLSLSTVNCKLGREITVNEIQKIEDEISAKCANKNAETVKQYVKQLDSTSGNFSQLGMWKLKNKLCPKQNDPPMAKKDKMGALITEPNLLRKLYLDT